LTTDVRVVLRSKEFRGQRTSDEICTAAVSFTCGYTRIPIVSWLRDQATESLTHAQLAGEMITQLGAYPSLGIGRLLDSHLHDIGKILVESMEHEAAALSLTKSCYQL
jgi:bacterioferritin